MQKLLYQFDTRKQLKTTTWVTISKMQLIVALAFASFLTNESDAAAH